MRLLHHHIFFSEQPFECVQINHIVHPVAFGCAEGGAGAGDVECDGDFSLGALQDGQAAVALRLVGDFEIQLSGVWFDLQLVGGFFEKTANVLPFVHAAEMEKALFAGNFESAAAHILPVAGYSVLITAAAVLCFLGQMKKQ